MAKLTWTIETAAGTVSKDGPVIADEDMDRFLDWIWVAYPQFEIDGVTPKPRNSANDAAAFRDWADFQWAFNKERVLNHEQNAAAQIARDAISDF